MVHRPPTGTPSEPRSSEITPRSVYLSRRMLIQAAIAVPITAGTLVASDRWLRPQAERRKGQRLGALKKSPLSTGESPTSYDKVTGYNNFYEFGTDKYAPARLARGFSPKGFSLSVLGLVHKERTFFLEDLLRADWLEERIYRLRCVEGWSMVIPWVGFPLSRILELVGPLGSARHVEFHGLYDKEQMPGQRGDVLDWPYVEGLRLDEAVHPLTILAVGLYGETLPGQNGAPVRLVVPWKYGFKSIKSIVRIRVTEEPIRTTWMQQSPTEYGYYANVNPEVPHPRWSQAGERRLGEFGRRKTQLFNGYGEQVAHLYTGMDLHKDF